PVAPSVVRWPARQPGSRRCSGRTAAQGTDGREASTAARGPKPGVAGRLRDSPRRNVERSCCRIPLGYALSRPRRPLEGKPRYAVIARPWNGGRKNVRLPNRVEATTAPTVERRNTFG